MSFEDQLTFKGPGRRRTKPQGNGTTNLKAAGVSFQLSQQTLGNTNIKLLLFALILANIIIKNVQCWPFEKLHRTPVPVKCQHVPQVELGADPAHSFSWISLLLTGQTPDLNKAWAVWLSPAFWPLLRSGLMLHCMESQNNKYENSAVIAEVSASPVGS